MFCKSHLQEIFNGNLVMAHSKEMPSHRDPLEPYPKADPRMIKKRSIAGMIHTVIFLQTQG